MSDTVDTANFFRIKAVAQINNCVRKNFVANFVARDTAKLSIRIAAHCATDDQEIFRVWL